MIKKLLPLQLMLFYLFVASGLLVNFLQLLTLVVWPFNRKLYRALNRRLAYAFWSDLTALAQYWSGSDCVLYIKDEDFKHVNNEHALCIMNHKYDIDWLMGWIVCQRTGLLYGSKIIGKSSLRFVPLIGWCWLFTESIFIKRNWEKDRKILVESLDNALLDYPENEYFNILMFCEGTRFTNRKHEESMKVAREKGMPELKHHLLPRTKGFSLLARGATNRIDAIYDLTVGIEENGNPPDLNSVRNGLPLKGQMFIRRIPFSDVPQGEEESAKFLHQLYKEKDDIYDVFLKTGSFDSLGVKKVQLEKNYYDLYIVTVWAVILLLPMVYWLYSFMINSSLFVNVCLLVFFFIGSFGADLFISVSKTDAGSKYGLKKSN